MFAEWGCGKIMSLWVGRGADYTSPAACLFLNFHLGEIINVRIV